MKNKEIKLKIMVGTLIIIIIILTIKDITKKGSIILKNEIIKEMTQTEFDNQITQLNQAHTEYADYIQSCKDEIATVLTNEGVTTSNEETLETMASNISKVLQARTSDATATADNITEGKTAYVNGEMVVGTLSNNIDNNISDYQYYTNKGVRNHSKVFEIPEGTTRAYIQINSSGYCSYTDTGTVTGDIIINQENISYTDHSLLNYYSAYDKLVLLTLSGEAGNITVTISTNSGNYGASIGVFY